MGRLSFFTSSVTEALESLQSQVSQIVALQQDAQTRLRAQANTLLDGPSGDVFQGQAASALAEAIEQYLQTSEKLTNQLADFGQGAYACSSNISDASAVAEQGNMRDDLLVRVLDEVTLGGLLSVGASVIDDAMQIVHAMVAEVLTKGPEAVEIELQFLAELGPILRRWADDVFQAAQAFIRLLGEFLHNFGAPLLTLIVGVADEDEPLLQVLRTLLRVGVDTPVIDIFAIIPSIALDLYTTHSLTPRKIAGVIVGNLLQFGVGLIPVAGEVSDYAMMEEAKLQIEYEVEAGLLNEAASLTTNPQLKSQLAAAAAQYNAAAADAKDFSGIYDDVGQIIVDDTMNQPAPWVNSPDSVFNRMALLDLATAQPGAAAGTVLARIGYDTIFTPQPGDSQLRTDFSTLGGDLWGGLKAPAEEDIINSKLGLGLGKDLLNLALH